MVTARHERGAGMTDTERNAKIVRKVEWLVLNLGIKEPVLTKGEKEIYKQLKEILKGEGDK